jgi:hypothetical protein
MTVEIGAAGTPEVRLRDSGKVDQLDSSPSDGITSIPRKRSVYHRQTLLDLTFSNPAAIGPHTKLLAASWAKVLVLSSKHADGFASLPRTCLVHGDAHCGDFRGTFDGVGLRLIDCEEARNMLEDLASLPCVMSR